jgi:hypothetical protein
MAWHGEPKRHSEAAYKAWKTRRAKKKVKSAK